MEEIEFAIRYVVLTGISKGESIYIFHKLSDVNYIR